MLKSFQSLFRKLSRRDEPLVPPRSDDAEFSIEELEARRLPAADITSLLAAQGTASNTGSTNTADPVVVGYVGGDPIVGIEFEFDRNSDGSVDGTGFLEHGLGDFTFDLREIDPTLDDFEGTTTVRARAIELDGEGLPVAAGEWVSTEFFLFGPPPTLDGFSGAEGGGDNWTFSGSVGGAHAAGATIEFGGVLAGQSVQADSAGNFSLSVNLGEVDGIATAKVIDSLGQESEVAEIFCGSIEDPVVAGFSGSEGADDTWTFSGSVTGPTSINATVQFGGVLAGYSTQTDSCGYFSVTVQLGDVDGMATVQASDGDGRVSNEVEFYCLSEPDPPEPWGFASFSGTEGIDDYWTFSGMVSGNNMEGATVTFGGILAGQSAQLDSSGNFCLSLYVGNVDGYASASVVDPTGQTRELETYCCSQPDIPPEPDPLTIDTFSGTVAGTNSVGATVSFGGVLAGATAQVDATGSFFLSMRLPGASGAATAVAEAGGAQSNVAEFYLQA